MGPLARSLRIDWKLAAFVIGCLGAALAPLRAAPARVPATFPGWPTELDGRPLERLRDTPEEVAFYAGRSIEHARFSDGDRILLLRWADANLAGFHLARPCFLAYGYAVGPITEQTGPGGRSESCFLATRSTERLRVCEHLRDADGQVFARIEAWRVARLLGRTRLPVWGVSSVTPVTPATRPEASGPPDP